MLFFLLFLLLLSTPSLSRICPLICHSERHWYSTECTHALIPMHLSSIGIIGVPERSAEWLTKSVRRRNRPLVIASISADQFVQWPSVLRHYRPTLIDRLKQMRDAWNITGFEISWISGLQKNHAELLEEFFEDLTRVLGSRPTLMLRVNYENIDKGVYRWMPNKLFSYLDMVLIQSHLPSSSQCVYELLTPLAPIDDHVYPFRKTENLEYAINAMLEAGVAREKIIVSLTATPYTMLFAELATLPRKPYTIYLSNGLEKAPQLTGRDICSLKKNRSTVLYYIRKTATPYLINDRLLASYEDVRSAKFKASWASQRAGGVAIFNIQDDNMNCGSYVNFPLVNGISTVQVCTQSEERSKISTEGQYRNAEQEKGDSGKKASCNFKLPTSEEDKMTIDEIPYHMCSEIVVEEALLYENGTVVLPSQFANDTLRKLLTSGKHLKFILSVRCEMLPFTLEELLPNFMTFGFQIVDFVRRNNMHGVELDCPYSDLGDERYYTEFLKFLQGYLSELPKKATLRLRLPYYEYMSHLDTDTLNSLEFLILQPFDYPERESVTHISSPFFAEDEFRDSVHHTVHLWITVGIKPEKIRIQLPAYSTMQETVGNSSQVDIGDRTKNSRLIDQAEVCRVLRRPGTVERMLWDRIGWYAISRNSEGNLEWISGHRNFTVQYAMDYVRREKLGGLSILSLNEDDPWNDCHGGSFPLLRTVIQHQGDNA